MRASWIITAFALTTGCGGREPSTPGPGPSLPEATSEHPAARATAATSNAIIDSPSKGFLGATWGDDASERAKQWGLVCKSWSPWEGNDSARGIDYEACFETDHPIRVYGEPTYARLFRARGRLQGVTVRFLHSRARKGSLVDAIRNNFGMRSDPGLPMDGRLDLPYQVYADGSLVHFACDDGDDTCQLTVAGPVFGKTLAAYILGRGMGAFGSGLAPH